MNQAAIAKIKYDYYNEFEKLVRDKYNYEGEDFSAMPTSERNQRWQEMLKKYTIVVFPDSGRTTVDGQPAFSIITS